VTTVVVAGAEVGSAVVVGGTVWMIVGAAGVPEDVVHPAIHTAASRSRVRNNSDFLRFKVTIVFLYPDNCSGIYHEDYEKEFENALLWQIKKILKKEITASLSP
jgi:hypothetical protein